MRKLIVPALAFGLALTLASPNTAFGLRQCSSSEKRQITLTQTWVNQYQNSYNRANDSLSTANQAVNSAQMKVNDRNSKISRIQSDISRSTSQSRVNDLLRQLKSENGYLQTDQRNLQSALTKQQNALKDVTRAKSPLDSKIRELNRLTSNCSQY